MLHKCKRIKNDPVLDHHLKSVIYIIQAKLKHEYDFGTKSLYLHILTLSAG